MMNRTIAKEMDKDVIAALKEVGEKYGVNFSIGGGSFDSLEVTFKLKAIVKETSNGVSGDEARFKKDAIFYGINPDTYGQVFKSGGKTFKVTSLAARNTKYGILCKCKEDGKTYKFEAIVVTRLLIK